MSMEVTITLNTRENRELGIRRKTFNLAELEEILLKNRAKKSLKKARRVARQTGLSKLRNSDIDSIIKWVRKRA